jgi:phosphoribosylformylglycinamidine synthase
MREYIEENPASEPVSCTYQAPAIAVGNYQHKSDSFELPIKLVITDNTAHSVHKALEVAGIKVGITRKTHWEVQVDNTADSIRDDIIKTGELFNSNKEYITDIPEEDSKVRILVHDKEDLVGKQKLETLEDRFHLSGIKEIKRSTLWEIKMEPTEDEETLKQILDTHILYNPYYQDAVYYSA